MGASSLHETRHFWPFWRFFVDGNRASRQSHQSRHQANGRLARHGLAFSKERGLNATKTSAELTAARFLLWIDGVGGYLACTAESVVLGQPSQPTVADVPIWGDLSRKHAVLHRDSEGYIIEPVREVRLSDHRLTKPGLMADGQVLQLGNSVRVRFRQPHPLSRSARLEWVSHHRTQPATDGVVLLAETCLLGPGKQNHIVCPNWTHDLILFRHGGQWHARCAVSLQIDGETFRGKGPLREHSRIQFPGGSVCVERLE